MWNLFCSSCWKLHFNRWIVNFFCLLFVEQRLKELKRVFCHLRALSSPLHLLFKTLFFFCWFPLLVVLCVLLCLNCVRSSATMTNVPYCTTQQWLRIVCCISTFLLIQYLSFGTDRKTVVFKYLPFRNFDKMLFFLKFDKKKPKHLNDDIWFCPYQPNPKYIHCIIQQKPTWSNFALTQH